MSGSTAGLWSTTPLELKNEGAYDLRWNTGPRQPMSGQAGMSGDHVARVKLLMDNNVTVVTGFPARNANSIKGVLPKSKDRKKEVTGGITAFVNLWIIGHSHVAAGHRPALRDWATCP
jgi:hypothetical protein